MASTFYSDPLIGRSPFAPIADYAFLSDCESSALIAPSGNVEWMCLPRMDSPSVFGALLDRHAGGFRLGPADVQRIGNETDVHKTRVDKPCKRE